MVIAIFNNKGGVGKTTTAVNLAAGLAASKEKTVLVDLDSQGSASLHLGFTRDQSVPSLGSILDGDQTVAEAVRPTGIENLALLPACPTLASFDMDMAGHDKRETLITDLLKPLRAQYQWIVLDCPPSFSLLTHNALLACDQFLVPVEPGYLALEGLAALLQRLETGPTRSKLLGILPTMVDYRNRLTKEVLELLRGHFKELVTETEIRVNVRLAEASSFGKSIFEYDKRCQGTKNYRALVREMRKLCRIRNAAA